MICGNYLNCQQIFEISFFPGPPLPILHYFFLYFVSCCFPIGLNQIDNDSHKWLLGGNQGIEGLELPNFQLRRVISESAFWPLTWELSLGIGLGWAGGLDRYIPGLLHCRIPAFPHRHPDNQPQAPNPRHTPDKSIKIRKPQHQMEIGWGMAWGSRSLPIFLFFFWVFCLLYRLCF